jgi:transcriptional regulator with XRE-family HTH domain
MIDDDSTTEEITGSPNIQRVGKRLAIIREELGQFHGGQYWSQSAVAARVGLTQNIITRMEHGKGGLMENWLKLFNLYEQQGYNLHWVLTEDNRRVSKLLINDTTVGQMRDNLLEKINEVRTEALKGLDELQDLVENVPRSSDKTKKRGRPARPTATKADSDLSFLSE